MRLETQEAIGSVYSRVAKRRTSARAARNASTNEQRRLMLAGKVKAYTDILCLLKDRYGNKMVLSNGH